MSRERRKRMKAWKGYLVIWADGTPDWQVWHFIADADAHARRRPWRAGDTRIARVIVREVTPRRAKGGRR